MFEGFLMYLTTIVSGFSFLTFGSLRGENLFNTSSKVRLKIAKLSFNSADPKNEASMPLKLSYSSS